MENDIFYEYEMILIGKKNLFSNFFFMNNDTKNEENALRVFKFAIEFYLGWSPQDAVAHLNYKVIDLMKLTQLLKYIKFPPELDERDYIYIILGKLYPNIVKLNNKEITLKVYKRVLEKDLYKFPKDYLSGDEESRNRAIICFQYMLSQYTSFNNVKDMYSYFASSNGPKLLKKYRLNIACISMFEHPLDFLHESLPDDVKSEFWYRFYKFKITNNEQIRELKKQNKFVI